MPDEHTIKRREEVLGILETALDTTELVMLFDSEKEREEVWNSRTEFGRKKLNWRRCTINMMTWDEVRKAKKVK